MDILGLYEHISPWRLLTATASQTPSHGWRVQPTAFTLPLENWFLCPGSLTLALQKYFTISMSLCMRTPEAGGRFVWEFWSGGANPGLSQARKASLLGWAHSPGLPFSLELKEKAFGKKPFWKVLPFLLSRCTKASMIPFTRLRIHSRKVAQTN